MLTALQAWPVLGEPSSETVRIGEEEEEFPVSCSIFEAQSDVNVIKMRIKKKKS